MDLLNRSALVIKPKQPFLDWLHTTDPTSLHLTLPDLLLEPTIYRIPECDTNEDVEEVLRELCEEIFEEQLAGWYTSQGGPGTEVSRFSPSGSTTGIIPC
jgi:hypothetical protein